MKNMCPHCGAESGKACSPRCIRSVTKPELAPTPVDITATLTERGGRYGKFKDHAKVTQNMYKMFVAHMGNGRFTGMTESQQEAIHMIFHKLGRIANGDPNYTDSWVDIAGYAKLVADELEGLER
jgi:Domain of unknown function (DUF6378)